MSLEGYRGHSGNLPADRGSRSLTRVDGKARHGGYAHLPGGGPAGTRCGSCRHLGMTAHRSQQSPICRLAYRQLHQCQFSEDPTRAKTQARGLGRGPRFLKIGGRVVYRLSDVEAFEAANLHANTIGPIDKVTEEVFTDGIR